MTRRVLTIWAVMVGALAAASGCHPTNPVYLFNDGDLSHYVDKATQIEYPDAKTTMLADVENAEPPFTLENTDAREIWDLKLEEAVKMALANAKVMRFARRPLCFQRRAAAPASRRSARRDSLESRTTAAASTIRRSPKRRPSPALKPRFGRVRHAVDQQPQLATQPSPAERANAGHF